MEIEWNKRTDNERSVLGTRPPEPIIHSISIPSSSALGNLPPIVIYVIQVSPHSDENTANDLDLDDWDAIGLNVAKPPSVLRLYRVANGNS